MNTQLVWNDSHKGYEKKRKGWEPLDVSFPDILPAWIRVTEGILHSFRHMFLDASSSDETMELGARRLRYGATH